MTDPETVPSVGSQVARYSFVRELARGPLGPLFSCRKDSENGVEEMLARVVSLPATEDQFLSDAAWDSAVMAHSLSVRVADVVFGKGWVTLVHEAADGILLSGMLEVAATAGSAVPVGVATRIALDVLEGLEMSREQCESLKLNWRAGTVSLHSLCICRDGRVRSLDGQVMAAVLRNNSHDPADTASIIVPPEFLEGPAVLSERVDVFMVAALLWQLLTGQSLTAGAELAETLSAPPGSSPSELERAALVPASLRRVIAQGLRRDSRQRHGSLREFTVALVMAAERVASYPEVIEYLESLPPVLQRLSRTDLDVAASEMTQSEPEQTVPETASPETASPETASRETAPQDGLVPTEQHFDVSVPSAPRVLSTPSAEQPGDGARPPTGRLSMISWADDAPSASPAVAYSAPASNVATPSASPATSPEEASTNVSAELAVMPTTDSGADPSVSPAVQASATVEATQPAIADDGGAAINGGTGRGTSKPIVTRAALSSSRPPKSEKSTDAGRSVRPSPSSAVREVLEVLDKKSASKAPPPEVEASVAAPVSEPPKETKKKVVEVSVSTLILGFSTAILAVILIMLLVTRGASPKPDEARAASGSKSESVRAEAPEPMGQQADLNPNGAADAKIGVSSSGASAPATSGAAAQNPVAPSQPLQALPKASAKAKAAKSGTASKSGSSADSNDEDSVSPAGAKHPRNYVPNDL